MSTYAVQSAVDLGDQLVSLAAGEGSGSHPYLHSAALNAGPWATRNLSDAVHYLTLLHGRYPGPVEQAAERNRDDRAHAWFTQAAAGMSAERNYLAALVVAAGPQPSTHGQARCEAAVAGQRQALDILSRSDRAGCALGAAMALVLDWQGIRAVLDTAADRLGIAVPVSVLPDEDDTLALAASLGTSDGMPRTLLFGAHQLLIQHRGLWDLLDARQRARGDH